MNARTQAAHEYATQLKQLLTEMNELGIDLELHVSDIKPDMTSLTVYADYETIGVDAYDDVTITCVIPA